MSETGLSKESDHESEERGNGEGGRKHLGEDGESPPVFFA